MLFPRQWQRAKGRLAAQFSEDFTYILLIIRCSHAWYMPTRNGEQKFYDWQFWKLGTEIHVQWLVLKSCQHFFSRSQEKLQIGKNQKNHDKINFEAQNSIQSMIVMIEYQIYKFCCFFAKIDIYELTIYRGLIAGNLLPPPHWSKYFNETFSEVGN